MYKNKSVLKEISDIRKSITVRDIMRKDILTFNSDDTIEDALKTLAEKDIFVIAVCDKDRFIGTLTEKDLLKELFISKKPKNTKLAQVNSKKFLTLNEHMNLTQAKSIMKNENMKRALVVNKKNKIVGRVLYSDILESTHLIYKKYKYLLWNPWFFVFFILVISLLFLITYLLGK